MVLVSGRISGGIVQQLCHLIHVSLAFIINYGHTVLVSGNKVLVISQSGSPTRTYLTLFEVFLIKNGSTEYLFDYLLECGYPHDSMIVDLRSRHLTIGPLPHGFPECFSLFH